MRGATSWAGDWTSLCTGAPGYDLASRRECSAGATDCRLPSLGRRTHRDGEPGDSGRGPRTLARAAGYHLCDETSDAIRTLGGYHGGPGLPGSHDAVNIIGSGEAQSVG